MANCFCNRRFTGSSADSGLPSCEQTLINKGFYQTHHRWTQIYADQRGISGRFRFLNSFFICVNLCPSAVNWPSLPNCAAERSFNNIGNSSRCGNEARGCNAGAEVDKREASGSITDRRNNLSGHAGSYAHGALRGIW